jgi:hypothetical protein
MCGELQGGSFPTLATVFLIESDVESVMEVLRQEVFTWGALKTTLE